MDELISNELGFCIAYFYCSFGNTASQDPLNIFGSLVAQLSQTMPSILDTIRPVFEGTRSQSHRPPIEITLLENSIIQHSSKDRRILFLIDAINESGCMPSIITSLLKLAEQSTNLRILVTTTADAATLEKIAPSYVTVVDVGSGIMQDDIEKFVYHRLENDETLRNVSSTLKETIRKTLLKDADGSSVSHSKIIKNLSSNTCQVPLG